MVDDAVADEQLGRRRVDVAHGSERLAQVHEEDLVRLPHAVRRRRHADEPDACRIAETGDVEDGPAVLLPRVADRPGRMAGRIGGRPDRILGGDGHGAGEARVRRERGRERGDLAVGDADRDEAVTAGRDVAEALAEEHGAPRPDRRPVEELEVGDLGLGQSEQLRVARRYSARPGDVVVREPGREIAAGSLSASGEPKRLKRACEPCLTLSCPWLGALRPCRESTFGSLPSSPWMVGGPEACAPGAADATRPPSQEHQDGETGGRKQRAAAGLARRHVHGDPPSLGL